MLHYLVTKSEIVLFRDSSFLEDGQKFFLQYCPAPFLLNLPFQHIKRKGIELHKVHSDSMEISRIWMPHLKAQDGNGTFCSSRNSLS